MSLNKGNPQAVEATDDAELVDRCKSELPYITKSYEILLSRYETTVFRFCLAYLRQAADAEEVTQDVFLRVFHHIKGFEKRSSFKTWLLRIAQNQCSRRYGQIKKHRELNEKLREDQATVDEAAPLQMTEGLVMQTLLELGKDAREILSLRHLSELPLNEVAEILGLSASAAKMRHHRAVKQFRELYKKNRPL